MTTITALIIVSYVLHFIFQIFNMDLFSNLSSNDMADELLGRADVMLEENHHILQQIEKNTQESMCNDLTVTHIK